VTNGRREAANFTVQQIVEQFRNRLKLCNLAITDYDEGPAEPGLGREIGQNNANTAESLLWFGRFCVKYPETVHQIGAVVLAGITLSSG
jgi:hypothetical protein